MQLYLDLEFDFNQLQDLGLASVSELDNLLSEKLGFRPDRITVHFGKVRLQFELTGRDGDWLKQELERIWHEQLVFHLLSGGQPPLSA